MTILISHAHGRILQSKFGEHRAYQLHFLWVFALFFLIPLTTILIYGKAPADFGLKIGEWRNGLLWVAGALPIAFITGLFSSKSPAMKKQYPFSKPALDNPKKFALYEGMYLVFYYTGWEFLFRGVLLFTLAQIDPVLAILVQIIPSVLLHITHPADENWGAVVAGLVFGFIAYTTGSILYTLIIHASFGIFLDLWIFIRKRRGVRNGA